MGIFNFLAMADNYESRKVDRYDAPWGFVSTVYVNDASKPYETAVKHGDYNSGEMVIVETYDSKERAAEGHARWVATMTTDPLPDKLVDGSLAGVAELLDIFSGDNEWRLYERESN